MTVTIAGLPQLRRRLKAVDMVTSKPLLRKIQLDATANAKRMVPRKTGHLGRTIAPGGLTDDYTIVKATANYAAHVEFGTRAHVIKPRNRKVLAWGKSARLSGSARRGSGMIFARKVNHPGTKPQPYLVPGAVDAIKANVGADVVVRAWNRAA